MTPEIQALRERFRDQMPGLSVFDELATKYERLLQAQATIDQRWSQASPVKLQALLDELARIKRAIEPLAELPGLPDAVKTALATLLKTMRTA